MNIGATDEGYSSGGGDIRICCCWIWTDEETSCARASDAKFKKLIDGYYAAWSSHDPGNADRYYAEDAGMVSYDIGTAQVQQLGRVRRG